MYKILGVLAILITIASFTLIYLVFGRSYIQKSQPSNNTGSLEKVSIGSYTGEYASLVYIANEKGYFKDLGIEISLIPYQSGVLAIPDLLAGKIDIALGNEFAPVIKNFDTPDLKIIASIDKTSSYEFIAHKDHGINNLNDLKGKKIGIPKNTQSEFFFATFLTFNNLLPSDVNIIDIKPLDIPTAMESGIIDGTLIWPPQSYNIKQKLGGNAVSWPGQSGQDTYYVIIGTNTFINTRPKVIEQVLKALIKAEEFARAQPQEAQNIVMHQTNTSDFYIKSEWPLNNFSVSLEQAMLITMEDEARWAINNKITSEIKKPNFLNNIYFDGLMQVNPKAISIIR